MVQPASKRLVTEAAAAAAREASKAEVGWVTPTAVTYAAIQAAADTAAAAGTSVVAAGTITTSSTLTITSDADLSRLTINYTGTGVAVQIGAGTTGTLLMRKDIKLGPVINASKVGTGWSGSTVGVQATNTFGCTIRLARVKGFVTGYYAYGLGGGNVYNSVHPLHLDNNKRNLVLGAGTGGWSNSNTYHLGSLQHDTTEGSSVSGARQILIETAANIVNGNLFVGGSVEGNQAEYHLDCDGLYNRFDEVRWENSGGCRVVWRANAARNAITYGYSAQALVETHTAGSTLNRVQSTAVTRMVGSTNKAVQWLENTSSSAAFVDAVMDPLATVNSADAETAYRVARSGDATKMKRAADSFDRLILDHVNGRIYFGDGTAAPVSYLQFDSTGLVKLNSASLYPVTDNTHDLGINATRWRHIRARQTVITGTGATGSRPAAATGAGAMWFDTTLGKPIWSDGTVWRDAAGTAV